jgi:hypothetical protein
LRLFALLQSYSDGSEQRTSTELERFVFVLSDIFIAVSRILVGSRNLTCRDRVRSRLLAIGVSCIRIHVPSTCLLVVFNNDARGGIGGGSTTDNVSLAMDDDDSSIGKFAVDGV